MSLENKPTAPVSDEILAERHLTSSEWNAAESQRLEAASKKETDEMLSEKLVWMSQAHASLAERQALNAESLQASINSEAPTQEIILPIPQIRSVGRAAVQAA